MSDSARDLLRRLGEAEGHALPLTKRNRGAANELGGLGYVLIIHKRKGADVCLTRLGIDRMAVERTSN